MEEQSAHVCQSVDPAIEGVSCLWWAPHLDKQSQDNSGLQESKVLAKAIARTLDEGHKLRRRSTPSAAPCEPVLAAGSEGRSAAEDSQT